MKKLVFIAGPYTKPDPCVNTYDSIMMANRLLDLGYVPFVPLLSHFWHTVTPKPYEAWLDYDFELIRRCDAVLRMPGESGGADREVALAKSLGIPVFYSVEELTEANRVVEADCLGPTDGTDYA